MMKIMDSVTADEIRAKIHQDLDKVNYLLKEANNHKAQLKRSLEASETMLNDISKGVQAKLAKDDPSNLARAEELLEFWTTINELQEAKCPILETAKTVLIRESTSLREHLQRSQELQYSGQTSEQRQNLSESLRSELESVGENGWASSEYVESVCSRIGGLLNCKKQRYLTEHLAERTLISDGLVRGLADVTEELLDPNHIIQQTLALLQL
jgi:hypothetical protein